MRPRQYAAEVFTWSSAWKLQIRFPVWAFKAYTRWSQVPTYRRPFFNSGDDSIGWDSNRHRSRPVSASQATRKPSAPAWSWVHSTRCMYDW